MNKTGQVIREWVKGNFPSDWEIIDIGAGTTPANGVTRAVDADSRLFTKNGKELKKKVDIPATLKEYANYDASDLPYANGFFHRGISRWAIGPRIHGEKPIKELYRVLRNDGEAYIAILQGDRKYIPITVKLLKKTGFQVLEIYTGQYIEPNDGKRVKEFIIHIKKQQT